jgi:hypothetical protein
MLAPMLAWPLRSVLAGSGATPSPFPVLGRAPR